MSLQNRSSFSFSTGVAVAPDGQSLFFSSNFGLLQTDMEGRLLAVRDVGGGTREDIEVVAP